MRVGRVAAASAAVLAVLCFAGPAFGATAERISVSATGEQGDGASFSASMSADGRYTAFVSMASNLVPGDTNNGCDVFVRDNSNGAIQRVSVSSDEAQVDTGFNCDAPSISADGPFVAFQSDGAGFVPNETSTNSDVFVRDRLLRTNERVSVGSDGQTPIGNGTEFGNSLDPAISADGRFVALMSSARNLIQGRDIFETHVYIRDLSTGTTEIVSDRSGHLRPRPVTGTTTAASVSSSGALPQYVSLRPQSEAPSISADGRYVVFSSNARDPMAGDGSSNYDVFVPRPRGGNDGDGVDKSHARAGDQR